MDNFKLELQNLTKVYPGTVALKDFSAVLDGGKVYALLGKNGSGKSTLVKCISGAIQPTEGKMFINDRPLEPKSPIDAFNQGIAIVYQELSLVRDLTVAENILLGRYFKKGPHDLVIDWEKTNQKAAEILAALHIDIPVQATVRSLSVGQQQMIEIAKAMSYNPSVLILDEPTSALAQHEIESLFNVIRSSKEQGVIVIFITHKLQEIQGVADYVTVIRDSVNIGTIPIAEATPKKIVEMMFGKVRQLSRPNLIVSKEAVLEVKQLTRKNKFSDINFKLYKGEVLGIAGMLGSGRSELLRSIFGVDHFDSGQILINNTPVTKTDIITMKKMGLAMTPENRKEEGLVQVLSVRENLSIANMYRMASHGFLNKKMQDPYVEQQITNLQIKIADSNYLVSSLSGGNQQKVVVGNWLNTSPQIMFFDEPSRGIDVEAKQQIFQIMWDLSSQGLSSIFVSTELEELLEVCNRVLIMRHGRIEQEIDPGQVSLDELYSLCMEA
ncbi:MAG TPA: sugar ABC transporter ATP-binding protein [Firmicutes bacterium]|jgi:ribose transport system ATP-binding protein|nr:sugar ABC transporter ATP-binding protein [Bacillota bacterium]